MRKSCKTWTGIHHGTLSAIVNHDGIFRSPSTGKSFDLNSDMTDPLLNQLPVSWERYFTEDLGRVQEDFVRRIKEAGTSFCQRATLIAELTLKRNDELLGKQLNWFEEKVALLAQIAGSRLIEAVTERRRELANKIPLVARQSMLPAYAAASEEKGPG